MSVSRNFKLYFSSDRKYIRILRNLLGFVPGNVHLYRLAFRHKSVASPMPYTSDSDSRTKNSNERLEFLGDAVLGTVIASFLFKKYPYKEEGFLTEMRSKIVSRAHLNILADKLGLNELIEYDVRMVGTTGRKGSLLGDALEALVGAVFLDRGYYGARDFILNQIIEPLVDIQKLEVTETNYKSRLIEWCQQYGKEVEFVVVENAKGDSSKLFTVEARVDGELKGTGQDFNKKSAEKISAEKACELLAIVS